MIWQTPEAVAGWQAGAARRERVMAGTTDALLSLARVGAGQHVLDCGCGSGELALALASAVGPEGRVLGVDWSSGMLELARRTVTAANVEFEQSDLRQLDLGARRFDAAVSRNVVMLVPGEDEALRRLRAALRPGARFACSVWSEGRNPRFGMMLDVLREIGHEPPPDASIAMVMRLGTEDRLRAALEGAGFRDLTLLRVRADTPYASAEELVAEFRRTPAFTEFLESVEPELRESLGARLDQRVTEFGGRIGLVLPGEQLVAAGTA